MNYLNRKLRNNAGKYKGNCLFLIKGIKSITAYENI